MAPMSSVAAVVKRRTISGSESILSLTSEHLVNRVDRTFRAAITTRHGDHPIQERIRRVRRLEPWHGAEVVERGVNNFATSDRRDHRGRSVAQAKRTHRDKRAVVGSKRESKIHFEHAVRTKELPVGAALGQDDAAKTRTLKRTAGERRRAPTTVWYGTQVRQRRDRHAHRHQQTRVHQASPSRISRT